jgi:hypothetical protein
MLVADLRNLRPAPGQMGLVKTIQVGTEKAYLNDSWSWLGFDASSKFLSLSSTNCISSIVLTLLQPGKFISRAMEKVASKENVNRLHRSSCNSTTSASRRRGFRGSKFSRDLMFFLPSTLKSHLLLFHIHYDAVIEFADKT